METNFGSPLGRIFLPPKPCAFPPASLPLKGPAGAVAQVEAARRRRRVGPGARSLSARYHLGSWGDLGGGAAAARPAQSGRGRGARAGGAELRAEVLRLPAAMLFTLIGGLLPAACLAGGAAHARQATEAATMSGIIVQGSNTGSLLGAPIMALAVTLLGGWGQGYWVIVFFGSIGIAVTTLLLRPVEARVRVGD